MSDRIRILLIDDLPKLAWDRHTGARLPERFKKHFELLWIQNEREARWVLDAFELLSVRAPHELLRAGLPPELLAFDYALTQGGEEDRSISDSTYPVPRMREILVRYGIQFSETPPEEMDGPPSTGAARGKDRNGCFVGGEFARVFAAHPCGAVPTTVHMETSNTEAAFYEWLNERFFMDLFKDKSRPDVTWEMLLPVGVRCLRERMCDLAAAGVVRIDIEALQTLARAPLGLREGHIVMHSRFGQRQIPIEGLFVDYLMMGEADEKMFISKAQEWAGRVLGALFKNQGQSEFFAAKEIASQYWNAYISEAYDDRSDLSELAALTARSSSEEALLEELCCKVGVNPSEVRRAPEEIRVTTSGYVLPHWRNALRSNDVAARWAALFLAVHVEQELRRATNDYLGFYLSLRDEDKEVGEVDRSWLASQMGEAEVDRMVEDLGLRTVIDRDEEVFIELPIARAAFLDDILAVLDPLPESVLSYLHRGKPKNGRRSKMPTVLTNPLKRLGGNDNGWGTLGLSLSDVLDEQPFNCELCQEALDRGQLPPPGEHLKQDGKSKYNHGIRRGEGSLLRAYADEIGFLETKWPNWLRNAP